MTGAVFVVDTNVVVAGLLTGNAESPTARVLDLMLSGRLVFALSVELLAEYRTVLLRPRIRARHRRTEAEVDALLGAFAADARMGEPVGADGARSSGDEHLWALLESIPRAVLVTGDAALLRQPRPGRMVLTPGELLERLGL